jgi:hypothetical protein
MKYMTPTNEYIKKFIGFVDEKTIHTEFKYSVVFIEFIKPKFENVNFENNKIYNKLKTVFVQNQSAKAIITNLVKIIRVGLGFKTKSYNKRGR